MKTYRTSLGHLSPDSLRICRYLLAELWTNHEVDFSDLDPVQKMVLGLLQRAAYVNRDRVTGRYYLGDRSLLGETDQEAA